MTGMAGKKSGKSQGKQAGLPPAVAQAGTTRRSFLWKLWLAIGGLALLEYALIAADFLRPHRKAAGEDGAVVVAGPLERFEPGSVTAFPSGKFYLARLDDGGFLALSRRCTHLGCTVPWDAAKGLFVCPCHASTFDITGAVLAPPAPRPLDLHPVRIENGIVKVNTGERLRRSAFEATQVTRA
jgi:cytochrome b6-f complex iron-sulfur subunit